MKLSASRNIWLFHRKKQSKQDEIVRTWYKEHQHTESQKGLFMCIKNNFQVKREENGVREEEKKK